MIQKWMGAGCILTACTGCGLLAASAHKREEDALRQLLQILGHMENELACRTTPLPQLLHGAAEGLLAPVLTSAVEELDKQTAPDAAACMKAALDRHPELPAKTAAVLQILAASLGRYDLDGQLRELSAVRCECQRVLQAHCENQDKRLRSFRAMGICIGAVLAILLL